MFVNEFTTKILNKAKEFGISKDELLDLNKLSYLNPELTIPEQDEKEKKIQDELERKAKEKNVPVEKLKRLTDFDLESIEDLNLQELNRGDFEFYKKDLTIILYR